MIKEFLDPLKGIATCIFLMASVICQAQIDHYWSTNFNTSSSLLSGAVVGGDPDASSIFYNPAMISQAEQSNLALTANLFKYEILRFNSALGQDLHINNDQFNVIPRFISYTTQRGDDIDIEFAFFTRNQNEITILEDYSTTTDILNLPDGEEFYNGELQYKRKYSDQWFSLGLSQHLSENFTLGLGTYMPLKNYRSENELSISAFPRSDSVTYDGLPGDYYVATTRERSLLKSWNLRLLWKLGMHYQAGDLGIGLTITVPSIYLFGDGEVKRELSHVNIYDPESQDHVTDLTVIDHQEKVKADLKDPFSVAFGLHYKPEGGRSAIMMTAEYFAPIAEHEVMSTVAGNEQATESVLAVLNGEPFLTVKRETQAVLNVALGYRYKASEKVSLVGGIRTDFTAMNKDQLERTASRWFDLIPYDKYHFTVGADLRLPRLEFVTGIQISAGRKNDILQLTNFTDAVEYDAENALALQGVPQEIMDVKYTTISIFFGITYNFLTKK